MDFIIELILELVWEGSIEASKSNKIPKYIRYPLIVIISLFFIAVIGLIFLSGALMLKDNIIAGIVIILIGLFMLVFTIVKFRKTYLIKTEQK
ncbi:MAG: hypothetical protein J6A89_05960 [Clostridia bacterium]|nr:hypothetical protein [Clostridia bacterium]